MPSDVSVQPRQLGRFAEVLWYPQIRLHTGARVWMVPPFGSLLSHPLDASVYVPSFKSGYKRI